MTGLRLPDFDRSRAVLIGTGTYAAAGLDDLPGALRNLAGIREILLDPGLSGFPDTHVQLVPDPAQADEVMTAVAAAAQQAADVLLVYYAGHGLLMGDNSDLYLTVTQSRPDAPWNALLFSYLAAEIKRGRADTKILILDCCYSGRARSYLMADQDRLVNDQLSLEGLYVMTSTSKTKRANAPPGAAYTAFTGQLLDAAREGTVSGKPLLSMTDLFDEVRRRMRQTAWPLPEQSNSNTAAGLALIRNAGYRPVPDPDPVNDGDGQARRIMAWVSGGPGIIPPGEDVPGYGDLTRVGEARVQASYSRILVDFRIRNGSDELISDVRATLVTETDGSDWGVAELGWADLAPGIEHVTALYTDTGVRGAARVRLDFTDSSGLRWTKAGSVLHPYSEQAAVGRPAPAGHVHAIRMWHESAGIPARADQP